MTVAQSWLATQTPLRLQRLDDHTSNTHGFTIAHGYLDTFWLPSLGPSAVLALRRLDHYLNSFIKEVIIDDLAAELGVGKGMRNNSPIIRTLGRLVTFHMATITKGALAVPNRIPLLSNNHLAHLPERLRQLHSVRYGRPISCEQN